MNGRQIAFLSGRGALFWVVFAIAGAVIALRLPFLDIALGIAVILLGVSKLIADVEDFRHREEHLQLTRTLEEVGAWLSREYDYLKELERRYDSRLIHLAARKADEEKKVQKSYKTLLTKITALDRKVTRLTGRKRKVRIAL